MIKFISFFIDVFLVISGIIVSFWYRFPKERLNHAAFQSNLHLVLILVFFFIAPLFFFGVYRDRFNSYRDLIKRTFLGLSTGILFSMSFNYLFRVRWGNFPSSIFLFSYLFVLTTFVFTKIFIYRAGKRIYKKVIFIGKNELEDIPRIFDGEVDEIVLKTKALNIEQLYLLLNRASAKSIKVFVTPELYEETVARKVNGRESHSLILPAYFQNSPDEFLIRLSDIFISFFLLILFLPVMIVIAIVLKLDSSGGIFYRQTRVGLGGREFELYKFRSMIAGAAEASRPEGVSLNEDNRVTRFGRFLRRMRLDELPQLYNIIKGDMNLVGPRPEALYRVSKHKALQGIRLSVRPGLTGLAQIEGHYHTSPHHKLKYDYLYIKNRTFLFNLKIILKTIPVILSKPGS
jgi:lipopolysaccharide/colanic/teichoic acid biosynthesis glycosyltransferase